MKTLLLVTLFGLLATPVHVVNFDNAPLGQLPNGWSVPSRSSSSTHWEIRRDQSAPTQPYVFARVAGNADNPAPVAIFESLGFRDGEISVRLKPVSGNPDLAGGLVFRYRDENNYYVARADATQQNVSLLKIENGRRIQIGSAVKREVPPQAWSILKVWVRGPRVQIYVDHRRMLRAEERSFTASGKTGLWAPGDAVTYFDDFRIDPR